MTMVGETMLYYMLYGMCWLMSLWPYKFLYFISDYILFPLLYTCIGYRRKIVHKNLFHAFPEMTDEERLVIEKQFYHFFCDYFFETIKLVSVSKKEMKRRIEMTGLDALNHAFEKKDMVIVYLGHYCNWEYVASLQWWMDDVQCAQLYSTLRQHAFDRLFLKIRSRFGGICIEKNRSLRQIMELKHKHQKTVIGFIADQGPRWPNIHLFLPFLHQDTAVFTGAERIAHKVDAAVFVANMSRPKRGYYHCEFVPISDKDVECMEEFELTRLYMDHLEQQIKKCPYLWLWSHNRWRRQRTDSNAPEEWRATVKNGRPISDTPIKTHQ